MGVGGDRRAAIPPSGLLGVTLVVAWLGGCSAIFPFETDPERSPEACANALDDDLDGATDCDDPSCDGFCPEASIAACDNGRDDDGDGRRDLEEPACWAQARITADECLSFGGVEAVVTSSNARSGARGAFLLVPDPRADPVDDCEGGDVLECAIRIDPPTNLGSASIVPFLATTVPFQGGDTLRVAANVELTAGPEGLVEAVIGLAPPTRVPEFEVIPGGTDFLLPNDAVVLRATFRQTEDRATLELTLTIGDVTPREVRLPPEEVRPGPFSITLEATRGQLSVRARSTTGAPPDLVLDDPEAGWPAPWNRGLDLAVVLWGGVVLDPRPRTPVLVRRLELLREPRDPCGYRVPQLPAGAATATEAPGRVLAIAGDDSRLCALGWREPLSLATPGGLPRLPIPLTSWTVEAPFDEAPVPGASGATIPRGLLAASWSLAAPADGDAELLIGDGAAMAVRPDGGFEAIVVDSDGEGETALRRLESEDCSGWADAPLDLPDDVAGGVPVGLVIDPTTGGRTLHLLADAGLATGIAVDTLEATAERPGSFGAASRWDLFVDALGEANDTGRIVQVLDGPDPAVVVFEDDGEGLLVVSGDARRVGAGGPGSETVTRLFAPTALPGRPDRFGVRDLRLLAVGGGPDELPAVLTTFRGNSRLTIESLPVRRVAVGSLTLERIR